MNEREIVKRIRSLAAKSLSAGVRVPIGDDCAVVESPPAGFELAVTTDQLIESKHFSRDLHPADLLGGKLLARGLSDLAAMGARPAWYALSVAWPPWAEGEFIERFFSGLIDKADRLGLNDCPLIGGDIASADRFSAAITAAGLVPAGRALLRSRMRPGDRIWVSGILGGSALGLKRLLTGKAGPEDPAVDRHLDPIPRLALGAALLEAGVAAAMDVSDGLSIDLARMAEASGVGAILDLDRLPVFPGASVDQALHGGEEYELLFAAPAGFVPPEKTGRVPLTPIGEAVARPGLRARRGAVLEPLEVRGFDHFG